MMSPLQEFLWNRKVDLLQKEKRAIGTAQLAITMQLQVIDAMFQFLNTQQTEDDMAKLQLTLDTQATPVDDIKPRQDNQELTEGLIDLAEKLEKAWQEEVKRAKKEGRKPNDLKFPLNNLPKDIVPKSVSTKIYALRTSAKLPENVLPSTRTITVWEARVDEKTGEEIKVAVKKEALYLKWVQNPPPVKSGNKGE